jgi:hypothetical protein
VFSFRSLTSKKAAPEGIAIPTGAGNQIELSKSGELSGSEEFVASPAQLSLKYTLPRKMQVFFTSRTYQKEEGTRRQRIPSFGL